VGRNYKLEGAVNSFFDSIDSKDIRTDSVVKTIDGLIKLISVNIRLAKGHENFNIEEWKDEKNSIFDLRVKYIATKIKNKSDFKDANKLYNKHKKLQDLLIGK
jgi:hypothetical protein